MSDLTIRHSIITLYKDCQIIPSRNFVVDSISDYLATLSDSLLVDDFQYLRNTLELSIKIHKNENFTAILNSNNYNYLKVVQDSTTYYYFIIKKTQLAEETIQLDLRMDVLNTFPYGSAFTSTNKTKILRQHRDRFVNQEILDRAVNEEDVVLTELIGSDEATWIYAVPDSEQYLGNAKYIVKNLSASITYDSFTYIVSWGGTPKKAIILFTFKNPSGVLGVDISFDLMIKGFRNEIDLYSEGLTPILYKEEKGILTDDSPQTWYLIYKTNNQATEDNPQPVNCYLCPSESVPIKESSKIILDYQNVDSGKVYHFVSYVSPDTKISSVKYAMFSGNSIKTNSYPSSPWEIQFYGFIIDLDPNNVNKLRLRIILWKANSFTGTAIYSYELLRTYSNLSNIELTSNIGDVYCYKANSFTSNISTILGDYTTKLSTTLNSVNLRTINEYDRTDSKILKIIALPYLPTPYEIDNSNNIVFGGEWEFDATEQLMKLTDLNIKFDREVITDIESPYKVLQVIKIRSFPEGRIMLDPKLYHSDFYKPKFVYDSFSFVFQLEKMKRTDTALGTGNFTFSFVMTSTIRSRFMFKFNDYDLLYSTEDYDNILNINRNNEAVIYSSNYLNYLRTGYNIDIKAKERTQTTAILGGVLSTIGSIAGVGLGLASGNPAVAVRSALSGGTSIASSIISSVNTIAQSEESMERNLATLKAQAVSVEGSDDLDLLENYSKNRAKYVLYKVSPRLRNALDDLFYYTGYISNEVGVPVVNTRTRFNFLSCELDITGVNINIPQLCIEEIKNLYREGITFLHKYSNTWDFAQVKENWEVALIGG